MAKAVHMQQISWDGKKRYSYRGTPVVLCRVFRPWNNILVTTNPEEVTCKSCLRKIEWPEKK